MTYNPEIPLVTSSPKDSASPIQVNFSQISSIFSSTVGGVTYNHIPFNNQSQGKHAAVLFQNQTNAPGVTQDLVALYSNSVTSNISTEPQLFVQIPKFLPTDEDTTPALNTPMQLTYNKVNIAGPIYQSFLSGGYIVYFGNVSTLLSPYTITLSPVPTKILCAIAMPNTVQTNSTHQPIPISTVISGNSVVAVYTTFTGSRSFNFLIVGQA